MRIAGPEFCRVLLPAFAAVLAWGAASSAVSQSLPHSVPMLIQAEAMSTTGSTAPLAVGNDFAAMGGRVLTAPSNSTTRDNPVRGASVRVDLAGGSYFLWARLAGPTALSDALYVGIGAFARVFPQAQGPYEWVRVPTNEGSGTFEFKLNAGSYDIQVAYGEVGAKLDALYLTNDAADVPAFAAAPNLLIEAESLNRVAPMTVASEATALGGQYLTPTSASSTTAPEAWMTLDLAANTPYYLWARITGPGPANDALYVGIDSFARVFPQQGPAGTYEWVKVPTVDGGTLFGFTFNSAGARSLQVRTGEAGAKLDALYLTTDANEVPKSAPMRRVIEAESFNARQTPPMLTVRADSNASGGQYLTTTSQTNSASPPALGEASATLSVPANGTYFLWARVMGPTINNDAVYVGFNNTFVRIFPSTTGSYEWIRVEANAGTVTGSSLSAGTHTIDFAHAEVGARLDAVYVTDDENDFPPGAAPCALPTGKYQYQGFGGNTTGGLNQPIVAVTNLNNSGPGSLRDALSAPNRCIVFKIGGTIDMTNAGPLNVLSNVTIDGLTAPFPGITLKNTKAATVTVGQEPQVIRIANVNNVVVRGIRIRDTPGDGISVFEDPDVPARAFNVVIDRVSVTKFGDGAIDVSHFAKDVTIQWSILGAGRPDGSINVSHIGLGAMRVSAHHNLYIDSSDRQPRCGGTDNNTPTTDVTCDVRNNLIWDYTQRGTYVRSFGSANVVNNYYQNASGVSPSNAIVVEKATGGAAFVDGNRHHTAGPFSVSGSDTQPYPAVVPAGITDALTAARDVKTGAGARGPAFGLDDIDQAFIDRLSIP